LWKNGWFDLGAVRVVSGVGREMGELDEGGDRRGEGAILGVNVKHPIVTSGDFVA